MSDHYGRYAALSHAELYHQLKAGHPGQVQGLADTWRSVQEAVTHTRTRLASDLDTLGTRWRSAAAQEYSSRIGAISTFADSLAGDFGQLNHSLTEFAGSLAEALKHAEDPAATDDNDKMIAGARKGAEIGSFAGPIGTVTGGVIGGIFGHDQDQKEQQAAHQRMIKLVAGLAAEYDVTKSTAWPTESRPPDQLPGSGGGQPAGVSAVHGAARPAAVDRVGDSSAVPDTAPADGRTTAPRPASPVESTSGLLGVGGALLTSTALGAGAVDYQRRRPVTTGTAGATGTGDGTARPGARAGLIGAEEPAPARGRGTGTPGMEERPGRRGTGAAGARGDAEPGQANRPGERAVAGEDPHGGNRARTAPPTGQGRSGEDEADERLTWLTEDEMVWDAEPTAPAVLAVHRSTVDGE